MLKQVFEVDMSQMPFGLGFWGDATPIFYSIRNFKDVSNAFRLRVLGGLTATLNKAADMFDFVSNAFRLRVLGGQSLCKSVRRRWQGLVAGGSGYLSWHICCLDGRKNALPLCNVLKGSALRSRSAGCA